MATAGRNLSEYKKILTPNGADFQIGIVVSEWNEDVTFQLLDGAKSAFIDNGVLEQNIKIYFVPGAFELPLGCQFLFDAHHVDGIVAIGSVIQGETRHFDFVCTGATDGIMNVMLKYNKPVSYCLLTDNTKQQALDRSGGIHGNKGVECAIALLKMLALKNS
jgi:6,7-dimethyl-8-ribityllumazine synthase